MIYSLDLTRSCPVVLRDGVPILQLLKWRDAATLRATLSPEEDASLAVRIVCLLNHAQEEDGSPNLRQLLATARGDLAKMADAAEIDARGWEVVDQHDREDRDKALLAVEQARHTIEAISAALKVQP